VVEAESCCVYEPTPISDALDHDAYFWDKTRRATPLEKELPKPKSCSTLGFILADSE
jgi:hypothetical protein